MGNFGFITGGIAILAGVLLILFAYSILKPFLRSDPDKEGYERWLDKYGSTTKILSVVLIIFGIYLVIDNNPDDDQENAAFQFDRSEGREWSDREKQSLTNECVRMYINDEQIPESDIDIAYDYCQCTTEKMTDEYSIQDLLAHDTLSNREKVNMYEPVVETCIRNLEDQLNTRYQFSDTEEQISKGRF